MSNQIKSGDEAIAIARKVAETSGLVFFTITEAKQEYDNWLVIVESLGNRYQATIASTSGALTEWKRITESTRSGQRS